MFSVCPIFKKKIVLMYCFGHKCIMFEGICPQFCDFMGKGQRTEVPVPNRRVNCFIKGILWEKDEGNEVPVPSGR